MDCFILPNSRISRVFRWGEENPIKNSCFCFWLPQIAYCSRCVQITDAAFLNMFPPTSLTTLNLNSCSLVSKNALKSIVQRFHHLQALSLAHCLRINDDAISILLPLSKTLRILDVSYCALSHKAIKVFQMPVCRRVVFNSLSYRLYPWHFQSWWSWMSAGFSYHATCWNGFQIFKVSLSEAQLLPRKISCPSQRWPILLSCTSAVTSLKKKFLACCGRLLDCRFVIYSYCLRSQLF